MKKKLNHKVINDFLTKKELQNLINVVMGNNFSWFFQEKVNINHSKKDTSLYFTHLLFENNNINSDYYNYFNVIIKKLNAKSLIRVKVNCYPNTHKLIENKPHYDYNYPHKGCVFYFNTCDGYTKLNDGTKVESVANRALFFDPSIPHQSTNCTNAKARFNININYL
jgi:hypothetical protein